MEQEKAMGGGSEPRRDGGGGHRDHHYVTSGNTKRGIAAVCSCGDTIKATGDPAAVAKVIDLFTAFHGGLHIVDDAPTRRAPSDNYPDDGPFASGGPWG